MPRPGDIVAVHVRHACCGGPLYFKTFERAVDVGDSYQEVGESHLVCSLCGAMDPEAKDRDPRGAPWADAEGRAVTLKIEGEG